MVVSDMLMIICEMCDVFDVIFCILCFYELCELIFLECCGQYWFYDCIDWVWLMLILCGKCFGFLLEQICQFLEFYDFVECNLMQVIVIIVIVCEWLVDMECQYYEFGFVIIEFCQQIVEGEQMLV